MIEVPWPGYGLLHGNSQDAFEIGGTIGRCGILGDLSSPGVNVAPTIVAHCENSLLQGTCPACAPPPVLLPPCPSVSAKSWCNMKPLPEAGRV